MVDFIVADPTGNITVLVTDPVPAAERAAVTREVFNTVPACEQVGYITGPVLGGFATDRIEMMGGEFCGNATLSLAAYVARRDGITEPSDVEVECSGVDRVITCTIRLLGPAGPDTGWVPAYISSDGSASDGGSASGPTDAQTGAGSGDPAVTPTDHNDAPGQAACRTSGKGLYKYEGTLEMPAPLGIEYCDSHPVVFLPGIAHMIMPADRFTRRQVENTIRDYAARFDAEAFGILLWDEAAQYMTPCVYVRGSDTVVWENGCATGSTCIGWYRFMELGERTTAVRQPGGTITLRVAGGRPYLTGTVII